MNGEREGDVMDSRADADQPVSTGARTRRGVLARLGFIAVAACLLDLEFALGLGSSDWALVVGPIVFLVLLLLMLAGTAEWTIAGHELRRRGWLSRPGREPSLVMELGPQVEIVHETRRLWRMRPNGLALGGWQTRRLLGAMEGAGVRVNDWRGDWARRHRLLDTLGGLALYGGLAGMIVMPALGWHWSLFRAAVGFACSGAVLLGLAIDYLPWSMRKTPAHDGWPPLPAGGSAEGSANESTRPSNVRQGATAGIIVSFVAFVAFVAAASAAGSSHANPQTFVLLLAVPLTVMVVITAVALAINRRAGRPRDL
jgi:hypothetical protein